MQTEIQKGSSVLRPRARLIKTVGEELISSDIVAIVELIKNSYDADADIITIDFTGNILEIEIEKGRKKQTKKVFSKDGASITISDDGSGMTLDTIKKSWMEPATNFKKIEKISPVKKRRYTGEKGIGRFASAKLSSTLKIVTKVENDNEVVVNFDWSAFANEETYLDEVFSHWEVRQPLEIKKKGTKLLLDTLKSDWDELKFQSLRAALSRLINPVAPVIDFLIDVNIPKEMAEELSGIISPPESTKKPNYIIKGKVDGKGQANLEYISKKSDKPLFSKKDLTKEFKPMRTPVSGPFEFEFRVWDLEKESLTQLANEIGSTTSNVAADLQMLSGVSIYRDKFRVLPYGEPKNDWLRLNARRVNNPTLRLSVNQIIGYISISLEHNPDLKDQSNREGFIESEALNDLQVQVISIISELEEHRYAERPRREEEKVTSESLVEKFSIEKLATSIVQKIPNDKEVLDLVHSTQARISDGLKHVQEILSRYRRLSTLGLLIDAILHDGGNLLLRIDSEARKLENELKKKNRDEELIIKYLKGIQEQREIMAQLFKRIEPFGGRKRGRPYNIVVEHAVKNMFELHSTELIRSNIECSLPNSENTVTIDNGEFQTIIMNLLQNSIYWLQEKKTNRKIAVEVHRNDSELSIVFSDNGPGIPEAKHHLIFDPYFSGRPDGIGLGLTIVGELVAEYNGDFLLMKDGPLDGATFKIIFRKRI